MSEFDSTELPEPERMIPSHNQRDDKTKFSLLKGCLLTFLSIFLLITGITLLSIFILIYKGVDSSSNFMVSFNDNSENIREDIILTGKSASKIVLINIKGIIYPGDSISKQHSSSESIIRQLHKAGEDAKVKAVILDMNTPGGEVIATDEIHHEIQKIRKKGIKVLTCMRTVAASGGYYLAAGTDYIIANRLTLTGSIGVIIGGYNYRGLFKLLGVKSEIYKSGKYKDLLNMGRERQEDEMKLVQDMVDETHSEFAKIVAAGRNMDLQTVMTGPIGDAAIFSGKQAQELKLIDELGYLEDAIQKARQMISIDDPTILRYHPRQSLTDYFFSMKTDFFSELFPGSPGIIQKGNLYYLCPLAL